MDSEDDMLDMYSGEDDFYSDDYKDSDNDDDDDDDDGEPDYGFVEEDADDSAMIASHRSQKNYCVLREEDILRHQVDDIERVSVVLSITEVEASILLRHYHWSVGKVHDEWFADEERVRNTVGILENPVVPPSDDTELTCGICFDSYPPELCLKWRMAHQGETCRALRLAPWRNMALALKNILFCIGEET